jgi:hypothetical protein
MQYSAFADFLEVIPAEIYFQNSLSCRMDIGLLTAENVTFIRYEIMPLSVR